MQAHAGINFIASEHFMRIVVVVLCLLAELVVLHLCL